MRHRKNRLLELSTGVQRRDNVVRNLITSLVANGQIITTIKRGKVLKAEADSFFAALLQCYTTYKTEEDATREIIRRVKAVIFTETEGKKLVRDLLPQWKNQQRTFGLVSMLKLGPRAGDSAETVVVRLGA